MPARGIATQTDFLVIGGGVIGLSIARNLRKEFVDSSVTLIEKESSCGIHASGRNSGVLHAGFYYSPDSLKARFTRLGNEQMTAYCQQRGIRINRCGKLVVAKDETDLPGLHELVRRGKRNGIRLEELSEEDAKRIEPRVKTYQRALFSPTTSTVDPHQVMRAMVDDAKAEGVQIRNGEEFVKKENRSIHTTSSHYEAGFVVNAAGLYADRIARQFGFSERYRILPFKGLYLYSEEPAGSIRTNIYPVPNLQNPFLGVHFTVTTDGKAKIGPTAIPALWLEHYDGLRNFRVRECAEILLRGLGLMANGRLNFARLAIQEIRKYSRVRMVELASALATGVRAEQFLRWGEAGIRAQLLDVTTHTLEMDFVLEGDRRSMHVLNAVSPGFTCSLPFSQHVCEQIRQQLN